MQVLAFIGNASSAVPRPMKRLVNKIQETLAKAQHQKNMLDDEWLKSVDERTKVLSSDSLPVAPAGADALR
jgi:hypothetical protein